MCIHVTSIEYEAASRSQEGIYTKKTQTQYEYYIDVRLDICYIHIFQ